MGFATVEFIDKKSAAKVLETKFHKMKNKHIKCKMKLLKSEIDQRRTKEEIGKYIVSNINEHPFGTPDVTKKKTTSYEDMTPNLGPKLHKTQTMQSPPPPLGDLQRPLDPRLQAFRQQEMKKLNKYKHDYRSDLRDIKFNTKPQFDFYFSAPDQNIVEKRTFDTNKRKRKYSSPHKSNSNVMINGGFDSRGHPIKVNSIKVMYESGVPEGMDEAEEMENLGMMDMDPFG